MKCLIDGQTCHHFSPFGCPERCPTIVQFLTVKSVDCPEHGACLCYGEENGIRIYRCELGHVRLVKILGKDGQMSSHTEYVSITHREYWFKGGILSEVQPHTSPYETEAVK